MQEWISVNDRLPEEGENVLVLLKTFYRNEIEVARRESYPVIDSNKKPYRWYAQSGPMFWYGQDSTHWMPLPEMPDVQ